MSADSTNAPLTFGLPVQDHMAREQEHSDPDGPLYLVLALVSLWGCAIVTWGLPALYLPAVALVPLCLAALVAITQG